MRRGVLSESLDTNVYAKSLQQKQSKIRLLEQKIQALVMERHEPSQAGFKKASHHVNH